MAGVAVDEKALGKCLQLARKRAGLTQQQLCQKAGLSYSTLAKIERGAIKSPSVFTVASIAQATKTSFEELLNIKAEAASSGPAKKRSKTGVSFVYFDINGTIIRFPHKAFTEVAGDANLPTDMVETIFWRHYDQINCGRISVEKFSSIFGKEVGLNNFDWNKYYFKNIEPVPGMAELFRWVADNYQVGLFTNSMPGSVAELQKRGLIPKANFSAVVDSSEVGMVKPDPKIYQKAQELAAVGPDEILLIDDTRPNLVAADQSGWQGLWSDETDPKDTIARIKKALEF